jgi:hypothetical protein
MRSPWHRTVCDQGSAREPPLDAAALVALLSVRVLCEWMIWAGLGRLACW